MNALISIIRRPYPYYIPFSRSFKLILWFSIGFPIFYVIVQPFGVVNWQCEYKTLMLLGMAVPLFVGLSANFYGATRILSGFFGEERWTIGKEIVWSIWNILTVALLVNVYFWIIPSCGVGHQSSFTSTLIYGLLIGLLPSFICVQFAQLQFARRKIKKLERLNETLSQRQGIIDNQSITLKGQSESLSVGLKDLLLIEAQDNYSKVVWFDGQVVRHRLIRSTLKNLEQQLNLDHVQRCHRSYIVNLANVVSVLGTSRGYKLKMAHCDAYVPVSRDLSKTIIKLLEVFEDIG